TRSRSATASRVPDPLFLRPSRGLFAAIREFHFTVMLAQWFSAECIGNLTAEEAVMARGVLSWSLWTAFLLATGLGTALAQEAGESAGVGTVAGVVLDKVSGDPVIEAGVEVVGTGKKTRTDLDGKYTIKVPAGVYEVRVFAPLYQGARLQKVTVRANEVTKADASLTAAGKTAVEVVEVVAQAKKANEATQLQAPEG